MQLAHVHIYIYTTMGLTNVNCKLPSFLVSHTCTISYHVFAPSTSEGAMREIMFCQPGASLAFGCVGVSCNDNVPAIKLWFASQEQLSSVLVRHHILQRQRTSDHRARESAEQRKERLSRCRSLQQQRGRDRHATEAVEERVKCLSRHCGIQRHRTEELLTQVG